MLWILLFLFCLCTVTFALCTLLNRRFEQTVGPVLLVSVLLSYPLALAGLLKAATFLLPIATIPACGYLLLQLLRKKLRFQLLTPGFLVFGLLAAFCWWYVRGRMLVEWDEFSHWGLVLKNMHATGQLYTQVSSTIFPDYPPALPLAEYLLVGLSPVFREDLALFAMGLFSAALLVYPLGALSGKQAWLTSLPASLVLFFVPTVFFQSHYRDLYVDGTMGLLLAFACFVLLFEPDDRLKPWLSAAALALLALTKGAGFPFALMGCIIAVGCLSGNTGRIRPITQRLGRCFIPLCLTLLSQLLWKLHLSRLDIGTKWSSDEAPIPALFSLLRGDGPEWRMQVVQRYGSELVGNTGYGLLPMSYAGIFLLLALGCYLVTAFVPHTTRRTTAWCSFGLAGAVAVYAVSLLYSYLFLFQPVEALMLASVSRYLGTPATALLAVLTALFVTAQPEQRKGGRWLFWGAAVLISLQLFTPAAVKVTGEAAHAPTLAAETQHDRYLSQHAAEVIRTVSDGSDVYIISPRDNGAAVSTIGYELAPAALPEQNSGIACLYPDELYGGYNVYCTPEEWSDILYNGPFGYVYLYQVDGYFVTGYRQLFENEDDLVNDRLLEIVRQENGSILLRPVQ